MTEVILQPLKSFPVTVCGVTLYLSAYKTAGTCVLKEQCTADNLAAVTASFPKGTRLTMEGKLAPAQDAAAVTAALAKQLNDGTQEDVTVRGLVFSQARLCGYTVSENRTDTAVTLVFYTAASPTLAQEDDA